MVFNKKAVSAVGLFLFFFLFSVVLAQGNLGLPNRPISDIITSFIQWLLGMALGLAILVLVYGGVIYVTSVGTDRIEDAKKTITYAVLGVVIIGISYSVVATLVKIINGT